jgi:hypothetical protein
LYRLPACYNGIKDWKIIKSDLYNCSNTCGFKLTNNENKPSDQDHIWRLICNIGGGYREPTSGTKRKYNGEEFYQEGKGKTTVK